MLDAAFATSDIVETALAGLTAARKTLPPKLFYDAEGVRLFEAITRLPEYYVTRTEHALLTGNATEIAGLAHAGSALVEYGASDEGKAVILLGAAPSRFASYVPIDVASGALADMQARMRRSWPRLAVNPICADFLRPITLPRTAEDQPMFGFFPGSTIGNLDPHAAKAFLAGARASLGRGSWLVVGVDLRKSPDLLIPAYDDAQGITAAFNLNMLRRLNMEAAADFDPSRFVHRAIWNDEESRIEMHLESTADQTVHIAGTAIHFARGETIHTENSYKHSLEGFRDLAGRSGWTPARSWTDADGLFSVHALRADS